jgi:hypothetical protein
MLPCAHGLDHSDIYDVLPPIHTLRKRPVDFLNDCGATNHSRNQPDAPGGINTVYFFFNSRSHMTWYLLSSAITFSLTFILNMTNERSSLPTTYAAQVDLQ